MKLNIWGVRGSVPSPGKDTVIFGGNTSCYEIITKGGQRLIFDAGTGIRVLGRELMKEMPIKVHLFISHTHWDHIQGFPFFVPAFVNGNEINIHGPALQDRTLEGAMRTQMDYAFFPVREAELKASLNYNNLREETVDLGDVRIRCKYTNHPVLTLSFRIEDDDHAIVYTGDTEPYYNVLTHDSRAQDVDPEDYLEIENEVQKQNQRHIEFCRDADILIHDAQYTRDEYVSMRRGWGHSAMEDVVNVGLQANAKHLILTSHDPTSSDTRLLELEEKFRTQVSGSGMKLCFGREGMRIDLSKSK